MLFRNKPFPMATLSHRHLRLSHLLQPLVVSSQGAAERAVNVVRQTKLMAHLLNNLRDCRVVCVADLGEEVVFDLVVQSTEQPGEHAAALSEVNRGSHLMHRPGVFHAASIADGQRKLSLLIAVGQLKHNTQNNARYHDNQAVKEQHHPPLMKEHGKDKSE